MFMRKAKGVKVEAQTGILVRVTDRQNAYYNCVGVITTVQLQGEVLVKFYMINFEGRDGSFEIATLCYDQLQPIGNYA